LGDAYREPASDHKAVKRLFAACRQGMPPDRLEYNTQGSLLRRRFHEASILKY
jgi:hypothetical protein